MNTDQDVNCTQIKPVGRRELLKVLVSGSGAVALSPLLPEAWTRPVIETGFLPVHAQTSGLTIMGLQVEGPIFNNQAFDPVNIFGRSTASVTGGNSAVISFVYQASFAYNDPLGLVSNNTTLHITEHYKPSNSVIADTTGLGAISANISGDGFLGTIKMIIFSVFYGPFQPGCGLVCQGNSTFDTAVTLSFLLETNDGRKSNALDDTLPRPAAP